MKTVAAGTLLLLCPSVATACLNAFTEETTHRDAVVTLVITAMIAPLFVWLMRTQDAVRKESREREIQREKRIDNQISLQAETAKSLTKLSNRLDYLSMKVDGSCRFK